MFYLLDHISCCYGMKIDKKKLPVKFSSPHLRSTKSGISLLAPVVQRPDNFIQWISHYPTVSICAKISVFPHLQANMHTLTTAKFGSVRKPWTTFNVKYIRLDPE